MENTLNALARSCVSCVAGSPRLDAGGSLRLAAIDLDGTLLAPDLSISAANLQALTDLQANGLEVVVASGRHYASILPFAVRLPGVRWIVSSQGAEVSDVGRTCVLRRDFLASAELPAVLQLGEQLGLTALIYTPDGIWTTADTGADLAFYRRLTGVRPTVIDRATLAQAEAHKVVWVGAPERIETLAADPGVGALRLQCLRTHVRLFEVIPNGVTKASGLAALAGHLGATAAQTVAFGDADNDIPMFAWAGESFAMAHGWPAAKLAARRIAPAGAPEEALARAVNVLLA